MSFDSMDSDTTQTALQNAAATAHKHLPESFIERIKNEFEDAQCQRILASTVMPGPRGLRFNTIKDDPAQIRKQLLDDGIETTPVPWCTHAAIIVRDALPAVLDHACWRNGLVHVQSLPSMITSLVLDPQPGERVLDLCAAPGGKTSHIAALMDNTGEIVANDRSRARCHRMRALLDQLGAQATVRTSDGTGIGHRQPMQYDRVLVDAPCSGEGRFSIEQETTINDWTITKSRRLASLQKSLLHSAIQAVRPGGIVVYSTCTYAKGENEAVINRALDRYGEGPQGIELDSIQQSLPGEHAPMYRSIPDPVGAPIDQAMEGFFIARLRRRER